MPTNPDRAREHTPGPWRMHDMETNTVVAGRPGVFIADCDARSRAPQENSANARLVIAAPDLLAALKAVRPYFEGEHAYDHPACVQLRAAIQKAES